MSIEKHLETTLAAAVRKAGSQSAFARMIGRRQSTINDWLRLKKPLPAEHVLTVERLLGISRHTLRPDIYPVEHLETPVSANDSNEHPTGAPLACRANGGTESRFETEALAA